MRDKNATGPQVDQNREDEDGRISQDTATPTAGTNQADTRVLNLYAGIGGNRKLWENVEVVAVENDPAIAAIYQDFFPNDTVIVADAHQYLLDHYREFDFIWSSPPCPTHSRLNTTFEAKGILQYPDMTLYQEIILLKHFCKVPWVVENVVGYYEPLIKPTRELARHYFWSNYHLSKYSSGEDVYNLIMSNITTLKEFHGITLPLGTPNARKLLRNCVHPNLGLHVFAASQGTHYHTKGIELVALDLELL